MGIHCQLVRRWIDNDLWWQHGGGKIYQLVDQTHIKKGVSALDVLWQVQSSNALSQHLVKNSEERLSRFQASNLLSIHLVKQGWECLLKFPSKQLVIKTPCQTGIGVIVEISKEAVPPAPMLSEEDTGHLATSQASLSSRECCICVLSQSGHLPHWIGAQLGNGKLSSWNPKSFPGSGSILGCLKKCEPFWERNVKPRNPCSSML